MLRANTHTGYFTGFL